MTENEFRKLALSLAGAEESAHMGHPDFRVGGKVFATLQPAKGMGMVSLSTEQQEIFIKVAPEIFEPVPGGWGRKGATYVRLSAASKKIVREAMSSAWRNRASRKLLKEVE